MYKIYFKRNDSFKQYNFESLEHLKSKLELDEIPEEDKLLKLLNNGQKIYACYDPYASEIDDVYEIIWGLDEEEVLDVYYSRSEDI